MNGSPPANTETSGVLGKQARGSHRTTWGGGDGGDGALPTLTGSRRLGRLRRRDRVRLRPQNSNSDDRWEPGGDILIAALDNDGDWRDRPRSHSANHRHMKEQGRPPRLPLSYSAFAQSAARPSQVIGDAHRHSLDSKSVGSHGTTHGADSEEALGSFWNKMNRAGRMLRGTVKPGEPVKLRGPSGRSRLYHDQSCAPLSTIPRPWPRGARNGCSLAGTSRRFPWRRSG